MLGLAGASFACGTPLGREALRECWEICFPERMPFALSGEALPEVIGAQAPDLTLRDSAGIEFHLADYRGRCPVVIEFGSVTWPFAAGQLGSMDELAQRYRGRAEVFFVYSAEAHPGFPDCTGVIDDATLLRQGATIEEFRVIAQTLHLRKVVKRRILLDQVDQDSPNCAAAQFHLPGGHFNSVVVVGSDGQVVFHQIWLNVDLLDQFLLGHLADEMRPLTPDPPRGLNEFGE
jgi:hypothetical protein